MSKPITMTDADLARRLASAIETLEPKPSAVVVQRLVMSYDIDANFTHVRAEVTFDLT